MPSSWGLWQLVWSSSLSVKDINIEYSENQLWREQSGSFQNHKILQISIIQLSTLNRSGLFKFSSLPCRHRDEPTHRLLYLSRVSPDRQGHVLLVDQPGAVPVQPRHAGVERQAPSVRGPAVASSDHNSYHLI